MLHKSFKPAKCKTSLKLAISRIKLMKNKKGVQINQMKRDLSQLLESSQDRTARIRVEHVIREEKMVAAYELIEIYCELIVARMAIIESQKICPLDLKEAVTSVIFAAPRCSDISELSDIRKHFTKKYGKEFVSAATELRPDCGVSRLLVEKLSAIAPDVQTKIKVLSDVAKEHNIKWDPTSFEEKESKPPSDLLNGPSSFEKTSMTTADPIKIQPSNIDDVHSRIKHDAVPIDFAQQNRKYTVDARDTTSMDSVGVETPFADMRSSGETSERMEMKQPVSRGNNDFSSGRENWKMEFKDATSAAQAAAESAERAAMAARAAAQFSRDEKIVKRHPTGSHSSDIRDEASRVSAPSKDSNERITDDRKPKIPSQQTGRTEHDISQKATSVRSDDEKVNDFHTADGYFEEPLNQDRDRDSPDREMTSLERFEESKTEDINCFAEEAKNTRSVVGNPFAVVDERNLFQEATKTSSNLDSRRDDEAISDDDDDGGPRFDTGFEYDEESPTHSLANDQIWNTKNTVEEMSSRSPLFTESDSFPDHSVKNTEPLETEDHIVASFDHSDGPDSESETDLFATKREPFAVESTQDFSSRKTRIELDDLVEKESSVDPSESGDDDSMNQTNDMGVKKELNFGTLTGGFRNKGGVRLPPYAKSPVPEASKNSVEESSRTGETSSLDLGTNKVEDKRTNVLISMSSSESDSDDYKFPIRSSEKSSEQRSTRSRYPASVAFFDDDGTDLEEEVVSKQAPSGVRLGSGVSRRTRGSYSKSHVEPEGETVISTSSEHKKPGLHSYSDKVPYSDSGPSSVPYSRSHVFNPITYSDEPTSPKKSAESGSATGSVTKASHVHPKLPDYDSIAARLESLRMSRQ